MNIASDSLIKYNGVKSCADSNLENFKQFNESLIISIPSNNDKIYEISKVWVDTTIIDSQTIKTPVGTSCEGQILTGNKLFTSADLDIKIEYISLEDMQSVQVIKVKMPTCSYVSLDEDFDEFETPYPSFAIEDIYCKKLNEQEIYINIMIVGIVDVF